MNSLPLQHFRRSIAQFASTPEAHALVFAGTGLSQTDVADAGFALTPELLWQLCDNVRRAYGPGWYLSVPVLWSLEVQGQMESASRFAPDLATALALFADYGHLQWGMMRWRLIHERGGATITVMRNAVIDPHNWQMMSVLVALNFQTILRTAFPAAAPQVVTEIEGPPPADEAWIASLFKCEVRWNAPRNASFVPGPLLDLPSSLADANAYAAAIAGLEALGAAQQSGVAMRVANMLGDQQEGRMTIVEVAGQLGISARTLERNLADEDSSFRQLQEEAMQRRFKRLIANRTLSLAAIAEQLGYSDESALSRATRRWHGATAAQLRRMADAG